MAEIMHMRKFIMLITSVSFEIQLSWNSTKLKRIFDGQFLKNNDMAP